MTASSCSTMCDGLGVLGVAAVALRDSAAGELAQPRRLRVPRRDLERRQVRRDQVDRERALRARARAARATAPGMAGVEPGGHLRARAQVRGARGRQPAVGLVEAAPGPHRRQRRGQREPVGRGVVRGGGGDRRQPRVGGERRPARRCARCPWAAPAWVSSTATFSGAEPLDQPRSAAAAAPRPPRCSAWRTAPLRQPVSTSTCPAVSRDDLVEVVDRAALLLAAQLGGADRAAQPAVAVGIAGEQQQVAALRIGHPVLRGGEPQRQLGAEDRADPQLGGGLGEADHAVHAVVVGERERVQPQRAPPARPAPPGWLAPSRKLKLEWQCSSAYGTRGPGGRGQGRRPGSGSRLRDQAGLSPPSASGPPVRLEPERPESAASSSDHGTSGLLHPMPRLYSNTCSNSPVSESLSGLHGPRGSAVAPRTVRRTGRRAPRSPPAVRPSQRAAVPPSRAERHGRGATARTERGGRDRVRRDPLSSGCHTPIAPDAQHRGSDPPRTARVADPLAMRRRDGSATAAGVRQRGTGARWARQACAIGARWVHRRATDAPRSAVDRTLPRGAATDRRAERRPQARPMSWTSPHSAPTRTAVTTAMKAGSGRWRSRAAGLDRGAARQSDHRRRCRRPADHGVDLGSTDAGRRSPGRLVAEAPATGPFRHLEELQRIADAQRRQPCPGHARLRRERGVRRPDAARRRLHRGDARVHRAVVLGAGRAPHRGRTPRPRRRRSGSPPPHRPAGSRAAGGAGAGRDVGLRGRRLREACRAAPWCWYGGGRARSA